MADYDVIVIGAGHNGLTTSMILQKNGFKVLNLEKNNFVGGLAANISFFPGHTNNTGAWVQFFGNKEIWDMLEIEKYGFAYDTCDSFLFNISSKDEPAFIFYGDYVKLFNHVKEDFGEKVRNEFAQFMLFLAPFGVGMKQAVLNPPVSMGKLIDSMPSVEAKDNMRTLFYSSLKDVIDHFMPGEGPDPIKGLVGAFALDGFYGGPMTPGSAFNIAFHFTQGTETGTKLVKGGIGGYSEAIARGFQAHGGELRLKMPVKKVLVKNNTAVGVQLENGQEISADLVVSNCSARYTFMKLVGEESLPRQFVGMVKTIKYRNPFMQVCYRIKDLPHFTGRFEHLNRDKLIAFPAVCPGLRAQESNWDAYKNGRLPPEPCVVGCIPTVYDPSLAPKGEHFWTQFLCQFPSVADVPREKMHGLAEKYADAALEVYNRYAPNVKDIVLDRHIWTPADYEKAFNADGGDFDHGTFALDQMLDFRPVPGWTNWATPVEKFYLCGSSTHPGWGMTSMPGINAANAIMKKWGKKSAKKR